MQNLMLIISAALVFHSFSLVSLFLQFYALILSGSERDGLSSPVGEA